MYTNEEYEFYKKVERIQNTYHKAGCSFGCLSGLLVLGSCAVALITPAVSLNDTAKKLQKDIPNAQKVIKEKRPYHKIQEDRQNY